MFLSATHIKFNIGHLSRLSQLLGTKENVQGLTLSTCKKTTIGFSGPTALENTPRGFQDTTHDNHKSQICVLNDDCGRPEIEGLMHPGKRVARKERKMEGKLYVATKYSGFFICTQPQATSTLCAKPGQIKSAAVQANSVCSVELWEHSLHPRIDEGFELTTIPGSSQSDSVIINANGHTLRKAEAEDGTDGLLEAVHPDCTPFSVVR
ncbi:hypothetical protein CPC08DRAFT_720775 [Agrocybe pediades]|nr:hypothetical protein CPC08DRAFT_720775 [Agrocybe pediades]